ncbi:VIT1/CCC1 transporter family protein [Oscillatoria amoena NRMC-F 0135]|nr:VIT1/CCC1 transporter family protein [Oscillatoria amoena NRMC-F 0135]
MDRISEVLFGLIMVLTFTGAISAATSGREEVSELLWAALGCNVAWGLVDAIMYLMNVMAERGHGLRVIKSIKTTSEVNVSREILREEIQPLFAKLLKDEELDRLTDRIKSLPDPSARNILSGTDLVAGVQIFLLVFLCTFPVALPFLLFDEVSIAMRASNGVALVMLFLGGYMLASYAGFKKLPTALTYALIGVLLVAMTMTLGG